MPSIFESLTHPDYQPAIVANPLPGGPQTWLGEPGQVVRYVGAPLTWNRPAHLPSGANRANTNAGQQGSPMLGGRYASRSYMYPTDRSLVRGRGNGGR